MEPIHRDRPDEEVPRIDEMTPEDVSISLEDIADRMADKTARALYCRMTGYSTAILLKHIMS